MWEEKDRLLLFCVLDRLQARDIDSLAALEQLPQIRIWRQPLCLATEPI